MNLSKELNEAFGDNTGRSVSRRIAQGFKGVTGLDITDRDYEFLIHTAMVGAGVSLFSSNPETRTSGKIGIFALFLIYQAGKR